MPFHHASKVLNRLAAITLLVLITVDCDTGGGSIVQPTDGGCEGPPPETASDYWVELSYLPRLTAIAGSTAGEAWAVGLNGTIVHLATGGATVVPDPPSPNHLSDVWLAGPNDIFAVGTARTILH